MRRILTDVKILYVQYANPGAYPPLEHSSRILAENGGQIIVMGISLRGTEALCFAPHPKVEIQLLKYCPPGWRQKLHFIGFGLWTLGWVLRWRPKWIYASDPFSCPIALALTFLPGLRVIYHEHDSPSEPNGESRKQKAEWEKAETLKTEIRKSKVQEGEAERAEQTRHLTPALSPTGAEREKTSDFSYQLSKFQLFILWSRKQLARRATFCVLPNEKRIEHFKEQTGTTKPVLCVWNCPRKEEAAAIAESSKGEIGNRKSEIGNRKSVVRGQSSVVEKFVLFYHGSIVPVRVPLTVLQAVSRLPGNVRFQMAGYETIGNIGYINELQREAARLGISERFEYLGAFAREELLPRCRKANIGLSLMPKATSDLNEQAMTGASNKPFDYLACGVPLLVSDLPEWTETFVAPGYALSCNPDDPESIAQALRWFAGHPEETRHMGEQGRERILNEWNYERQFQPVLEAIRQR